MLRRFLMPSQHSSDKQAVTYRLPRALLAEVRELAARRGETVTAIVEAALRRHVGRPAQDSGPVVNADEVTP